MQSTVPRSKPSEPLHHVVLPVVGAERYPIASLRWSAPRQGSVNTSRITWDYLTATQLSKSTYQTPWSW